MLLTLNRLIAQEIHVKEEGEEVQEGVDHEFSIKEEDEYTVKTVNDNKQSEKVGHMKNKEELTDEEVVVTDVVPAFGKSKN